MNKFRSRFGESGKPTTFVELHNGDVFRAVGFKREDNLAFRKASCLRAFRVQNGTWESFPAAWPVVLVDAVTESTVGERAICERLLETERQVVE